MAFPSAKGANVILLRLGRPKTDSLHFDLFLGLSVIKMAYAVLAGTKMDAQRLWGPKMDLLFKVLKKV